MILEILDVEVMLVKLELVRILSCNSKKLLVIQFFFVYFHHFSTIQRGEILTLQVQANYLPFLKDVYKPLKAVRMRSNVKLETRFEISPVFNHKRRSKLKIIVTFQN